MELHGPINIVVAGYTDDPYASNFQATRDSMTLSNVQNLYRKLNLARKQLTVDSVKKKVIS